MPRLNNSNEINSNFRLKKNKISAKGRTLNNDVATDDDGDDKN